MSSHTINIPVPIFNSYLYGNICACSIHSATGNATVIKPSRGFQDSGLAQVFSTDITIFLNITSGEETTLVNITIPAPTLPTDEYLGDRLQSSLRSGATAGGILGGFLLLIAVFFILRKRERIATLQQLPEISASTEPQELQMCGVYELHDPKAIPELPSLPTELDVSVPERTDTVSLAMQSLDNGGSGWG